MKQLESLNNDLFAPFKDDEITQLNKILGGSWTSGGSDAVRGSGEGNRDLYATCERYGAICGKALAVFK